MATPCTALAITRDRTPSAVQRIAVLAAAMSSAVSSAGRRPRRSLAAPYAVKTTVTMETEESQRSR
ncbi:hypothetical protein [Streptomyces sp. NPDC003996]